MAGKEGKVGAKLRGGDDGVELAGFGEQECVGQDRGTVMWRGRRACRAKGGGGVVLRWR